MTQFTLSTEVSAEPEAVYATLTDPARMRRWLYGSQDITDVVGPLSRAGSTFVQRASKGIKRPGVVIAADPPRRWHVRLAGFGERADLAFELEPTASAPGTRLTLTAEIRNGPAIISPILDRLGAGLDRRIWRGALERIREDVERETSDVVVGGVYALEGGGRVRIGHLIGADEHDVHLELRPGWAKRPPASLNDIEWVPRRYTHYTDLQPLTPTTRSAVRLMQSGADSVLADGGFGLAHAPMTRRELANAAPRLLGVVEPPTDAAARVEAWRERGGEAFGDPRPPSVGALMSVALQPMGVEAIGYGVVKLLRQELRGVHVRVYSNAFTERPRYVDESALVSRPIDTSGSGPRLPVGEPLAIGHLPLGHGTFGAWQPELMAMILVHPDELLGYEEWKLAKGGFF